MTYKVNDLVYFEDGLQKGVGKVVVVDDDGYHVFTYLVHSTQIVGGHDGNGVVDKQNNDNNWCFLEDELKPFTKKVGQKYRVLKDSNHNFKVGDIATLTEQSVVDTSFYKTEDEEWFLHDIDHPDCEVEFYADVEDAKEQKENEMFTKDDLKVGYLVKVRDGRFVHVVDTRRQGHCLNYESSWTELGSYSDSLHSHYNDAGDIMEVYGLTENGYNAHKFEVGNRKLLWKREEVKEMTIEDIQKALGHKIKVVE